MEGLQILLFGVVLIVSIFSVISYQSRRRASKRRFRVLHDSAPSRGLSEEERAALGEVYSGRKYGGEVHQLNGLYARHGITGNNAGQGQYHDLIDGVEVELHQRLRNVLANYNKAEVVLAKRTALVVQLNGRTLADAVALDRRSERAEARVASGDFSADPSSSGAAASQDGGDGAEESAVTLLGQRRETREEARLRLDAETRGSAGALVCLLGLLGGLGFAYFDLAWGCAAALVVALIGVWRYLAAPMWPIGGKAVDVKRLRGPLERVMTRQTVQETNISVAVPRMEYLDLTYPRSWLPPLWERLPMAAAEVEVDAERHVLQHGSLSLYEQRRRFPIHHWIRHAVLAIGAALLLILAWVLASPLNVSLPMAWNLLNGREEIDAEGPQALRDVTLWPGDTVAISGQAGCRLSSPSSAVTSMLDCSRLVWGAPARALPEVTVSPELQRLQEAIFRLYTGSPAEDVDLPRYQRALMRRYDRRLLSGLRQLKADVKALCDEYYVSDGCYRAERVFKRIDESSPLLAADDAALLSRQDAVWFSRLLLKVLLPAYVKEVQEPFQAWNQSRSGQVRTQLKGRFDLAGGDAREAFLERRGLALTELLGDTVNREFRVQGVVEHVGLEGDTLSLALIPEEDAPSFVRGVVPPFMVILLFVVAASQGYLARQGYRRSKAREQKVGRWAAEHLR